MVFLNSNTMETKITVTFADGSRRVLKSKEELGKIDENREASFVMDNGQVYRGYCDGEVDEEGDFCLMRSIHGTGIALPFSRLLGWCYKLSERKKLNVSK